MFHRVLSKPLEIVRSTEICCIWNWEHTKSKKIIVVDYTKKERKQIFNKLNPKFVSDNKLFWKTVKPLFSSKGSYNANIKLTDKDEIIQNDEKVAETLNSFLENAASSLILSENSFCY